MRLLRVRCRRRGGERRLFLVRVAFRRGFSIGGVVDVVVKWVRTFASSSAASKRCLSVWSGVKSVVSASWAVKRPPNGGSGEGAGSGEWECVSSRNVIFSLGRLRLFEGPPPFCSASPGTFRFRDDGSLAFFSDRGVFAGYLFRLHLLQRQLPGSRR